MIMKTSRTPKAVAAAWDIIVKSMRALDDEDRDVPLAQDLFHILGSIKGATLLANKRGLDPEIITVAMILHDLGRIPTGIFPGHDMAGVPWSEAFSKGWEILLRKRWISSSA